MRFLELVSILTCHFPIGSLIYVYLSFVGVLIRNQFLSSSSRLDHSIFSPDSDLDLLLLLIVEAIQGESEVCSVSLLFAHPYRRHKISKSKVGADLLDIFRRKEETLSAVASSPPFFLGSPPRRTSNYTLSHPHSHH
ncbi:hypothetical protein Bca101_089774 [Brassica carinata]